LQSEEDRATATDNTYMRKCGEIWTYGSWDMRADRQTEIKHSDCNTSLSYRERSRNKKNN